MPCPYWAKLRWHGIFRCQQTTTTRGIRGRMEAAEGTGFLLPRFWSQSVSCAKCGGELKHGTLEGFLLKDDLSPTVAL